MKCWPFILSFPPLFIYGAVLTRYSNTLPRVNNIPGMDFKERWSWRGNRRLRVLPAQPDSFHVTFNSPSHRASWSSTGSKSPTSDKPFLHLSFPNDDTGNCYHKIYQKITSRNCYNSPARLTIKALYIISLQLPHWSRCHAFQQSPDCTRWVCPWSGRERHEFGGGAVACILSAHWRAPSVTHSMTVCVFLY